MIEYVVVNDLTEKEARQLISFDKEFLVKQIGSSYFDQVAAVERTMIINSYREQHRRFKTQPLLVDDLVGRPVDVKVRWREAIYTEWQDL